MRTPTDFPSPGDVSGRRVVVTGASRGLGWVIAAAFHAADALVALVGKDEVRLKKAASRLGEPGSREVLAIPADVSDDADNEALADTVVARWGGVDVWIANAGISPVVGGPRATDPGVWREVLDVNLTGVFLGARAAARVMQPGGRIIATGSVLAERPRQGLSAYSASKAGVVALVKALALDLAPQGITVNAVNPGWFESPLTEPWRANEHLAKEVLGHTALERWGTSEDLAGAYLFLASPTARFVTGSVITVDGGYTCV